MATRRNQVTFQAKSVSIERATNGWIITPQYDGVYNSIPSEIATTVEAALTAAKGLMTKPFVREDDY